MSQKPVQVELNEAEWRLVQAIRALPESSLRGRVHGVLEDLLFYVANPRCQGMGAEGFPCGEPVTSCEACHEVWDLLDSLATRVKA
ncbi:hypothetical protein [Mesoterricola sediminis]|uniref:Uncharacterized protein n=1 Tax=Mesoterricola sediminis TaxID=2927980 RepID=A0AA48GWY7_9BACT|nr:hypothetical protein [Mesoterricola sediminis]BDU77185.1 hypothetical protein METESE_21430 [Mesoterricola sediminis]